MNDWRCKASRPVRDRGYFRKHAEHMNYPAYRARGWATLGAHLRLSVELAGNRRARSETGAVRRPRKEQDLAERRRDMCSVWAVSAAS